MTYNEYQELTKTTEIRPETATVNLRLMCSICGLIEELEELEGTALDLSIDEDTILSEDDIIKEAGDILYYIASCAIETGIKMEELKDMVLPVNHHYVNPAKILKKTYRDFNGVMPNHYRLELWYYLAFLLQHIIPAYVGVEHAMIVNINKLQDRLSRNVIKGDGDTR